MGWSWALWVVHSLVSHIVQGTAPEGSLVEERRPAVRLTRSCTAAGAYVDNFMVLGCSLESTTARYLSILKAFGDLGIALHELNEPTDADLFYYLGMELAEGGFVLRPARARAWRLYLSIQAVLSLDRVHGKVLRVVLGHVVNIFQLLPLALSTLAACYAYVEQHLEEDGILWAAVRSELDTICGFIFMVEVDLRTGWAPFAFCSDASDDSYAAHVKLWPVARQQEVGNVKERWRFTPVEKLPHACHVVDAVSGARPVPVGVEVVEALFGNCLLYTSPSPRD